MFTMMFSAFQLLFVCILMKWCNFSCVLCNKSNWCIKTAFVSQILKFHLSKAYWEKTRVKYSSKTGNSEISVSLQVSLFSINYFVISTAVALIITKYHGQSSLRLGHKNWNKWGFIAPWEQHAFWMISDWKIRKYCIFKTLITSLKIKRFSWKWSH